MRSELWLGLLLTVAVYYAAKLLHRRYSTVWLSPLIVTPVIIIVILKLTGISYSHYNSSAKVLTDMLQPATVAFAVPLYKYFSMLRKHAAAIMLSVCAGSLIAIGSSMLLGKLTKLSGTLADSIVPHSVTTPIAMHVSQMIGGIPAFTAAVVMITGIFGALAGPYLIRWLRIRSSMAQGLMLGTSAHGAGTARAFEYSHEAGTAASLAMIIAAIFTQLAAPWLLNSITLYIHF
ncbi:CidB/LrgB family autolysis modulator [Paenibacillus sp. GCM10027626]|uniref:CidB/LrgB family autolysis modulator n=1 Tax=Paenibacillus sp. GCM10027626 TaxID=3273411 RepID=UPI00362F5A9F